MSKWNHAMCWGCWKAERPDSEPVTVKNDEAVPCCICGRVTSSGIYIRRNSDAIRCKGLGGIHNEE